MQPDEIVPLTYHAGDDALPAVAQAVVWGALAYCAGLGLYMVFSAVWSYAQVRMAVPGATLETMLISAGGELLCAAAALSAAVSAGMLLRGSRRWLRVLLLSLWGVILVRMTLQAVQMSAVMEGADRVAATYGRLGRLALLGIHTSGLVLVGITPALLIVLLTRPGLRQAIAHRR